MLVKKVEVGPVSPGSRATNVCTSGLIGWYPDPLDGKTEFAGMAIAPGDAEDESIRTSMETGAVFDAVEVASVYLKTELTIRSCAGAPDTPVVPSDPQAAAATSVAASAKRTKPIRLDSFIRHVPCTGRRAFVRQTREGADTL
jgi:hypothetical protein